MSNLFDLFARIESKEKAPVGVPVSALVVCLGNPGKEYERTRHNAGFMTGDKLAERLQVRLTQAKFQALYGDAVYNGRRFLLMKPQTFMNLSGQAVAEAANFYRIAPKDIIAVSDDISLDVGQIRVRRKGSDGGQKGLRSITQCLGSSDFPRVRVGVGQKPHPDYDLADWVLGKIPDTDREALESALESAADAVLQILDGKIDCAMNQHNEKNRHS